MPALAIAIGGSAGYIAGGADPEPRAQAVQQIQVTRPTVEPIVMPTQGVAQPDEEIEVEPDPEPTGATRPASHGTRPAATKPKPHKTKPLKPTPCNVYDHMDGC